MSYRDFSVEYPDDPECGLRAAMYFSIIESRKAAYQIAGELDIRPSDFSRMLQMIPSDDAHHRRSIPVGKFVDLMRITNNFSPLATMCGYLGLDSQKLDFLRNDPTALRQQVEEMVRQVKAFSVQLGMLGVKDQLIEPAAPRKRRGKR